MTDKIARLNSRALIRLAGRDARSFLHNLLTQDVETLADGEVRHGALLSPPGRLLFDLFLWGEGDAVLLDVSGEARDALMARLSMYRLRAEVDIAKDERGIWASWPGVSEGFVSDPRWPGLGGRRIGSAEANAQEAEYDERRLSLGVPASADWADEATYPIEANFDLLNGIDFQKGCFVGQETTSRMKRRGDVKKRLVVITGNERLEPGAEILNGELRVGSVTSSSHSHALALVRLDRLTGSLSAGEASVQARLPDYFT